LQGIEQPEEENDLRKLQLMELAKLNGTLREDLMPKYDDMFLYVQYSFFESRVEPAVLFLRGGKAKTN